MATTKKRNSSVVHMLVAMLVLFVPVVLVTQLFTRNPEPPITPIDWQPVALGAVIGVAVHLGLDHFFNEHSRFAYFLSYRVFHGFSASHFYGPAEHARRIKRQEKQGAIDNKKGEKNEREA